MTLLPDTAPIASGDAISGAHPPPVLYEEDSYGWAVQQIGLLRAGRRDELDLPHLAQTLANLLAQERAKLKAAVEQILEALLKWDHSPEARSRAWGLTVQQQRRRLLKQIRRQPGLITAEADVSRDAYAVARAAAAAVLRLDDGALPASCPYSWSDIVERAIAWRDV